MQVAVECAFAGIVTASQLDVQVLYLPLQHWSESVALPLFEESHLYVESHEHEQL